MNIKSLILVLFMFLSVLAEAQTNNTLDESTASNKPIIDLIVSQHIMLNEEYERIYESSKSLVKNASNCNSVTSNSGDKEVFKLMNQTIRKVSGIKYLIDANDKFLINRINNIDSLEHLEDKVSSRLFTMASPVMVMDSLKSLLQLYDYISANYDLGKSEGNNIHKLINDLIWRTNRKAKFETSIIDQLNSISTLRKEMYVTSNDFIKRLTSQIGAKSIMHDVPKPVVLIDFNKIEVGDTLKAKIGLASNLSSMKQVIFIDGKEVGNNRSDGFKGFSNVCIPIVDTKFGVETDNGIKKVIDGYIQFSNAYGDDMKMGFQIEYFIQE